MLVNRDPRARFESASTRSPNTNEINLIISRMHVSLVCVCVCVTCVCVLSTYVHRTNTEAYGVRRLCVKSVCGSL